VTARHGGAEPRQVQTPLPEKSIKNHMSGYATSQMDLTGSECPASYPMVKFAYFATS
jgi:hypothetical protein